MVGVGSTPMSITSQPAANKPQATAWCSISPLDRVSRPTTTRPAPTYVPKAWAKAQARPGVRKSPTTPRIPDTPIFSRCSRGISGETPHLFEQGFEQFLWRISPLFTDHAHDRLGLAHAHMKPAAGPIDTQAVEHVHPAVAIAFAQIHQQGRDALCDQ